MDTLLKITLKLKSNPISTNSAYFSRNRSFTNKARSWRANFLSELQSDYNQNQIKKLKEAFDPKKHMISCVFHWFQPSDVLLTKEGTLSLRSMDVDNVLKIPTDCVFDKKYCTKWLEKCKPSERKLFTVDSIVNVDINDKFIFDTRSIKLLSPDGQFHCQIDILIHPVFQQLP